MRTTGDTRFRVTAGNIFNRYFYGGFSKNGYVYYFVSEIPANVRVLRVCNCAQETCSNEFDALYEILIDCQGARASDTTRVCGVDLVELFGDPLVVLSLCDDGTVTSFRRTCFFFLHEIDNRMDTFYTTCRDSNPLDSQLVWKPSQSCSGFNVRPYKLSWLTLALFLSLVTFTLMCL